MAGQRIGESQVKQPSFEEGVNLTAKVDNEAPLLPVNFNDVSKGAVEQSSVVVVPEVHHGVADGEPLPEPPFDLPDVFVSLRRDVSVMEASIQQIEIRLRLEFDGHDDLKVVVIRTEPSEDGGNTANGVADLVFRDLEDRNPRPVFRERCQRRHRACPDSPRNFWNA